MKVFSPVPPRNLSRGPGRLARWIVLAIFKIILLTLAALLGSGAVGLAAEDESRQPSTGADASTGTITYVRNGSDIRLIEPDGSNNRLLWRSPDPAYTVSWSWIGNRTRPKWLLPATTR